MLRPLVIAFLLLQQQFTTADEITFRRHVLNPQSEFSACAAIDVNRDGRLDIVSGEFWYQAPNWKKHTLREVENIRGRYDDYSNLPVDVNGDGQLDLVSVNYRSKSLYWVENLGPDRLWPKHVIDTPGPSETGRLFDIDGDGRLDVLPNGMDFAAWYEFTREPQPDGSMSVHWLRNELPEQSAGHGNGFGDINGDGRGDLVATGGWAEAPENARGGRWLWHPEFRLHRDAGLPILVCDVDRDGDNDLIWGRGHNIGIYWSEQQIDSDGKRNWTQHAIDTSWSQAHSLMLADINGDDHPDLVTGKRYLGHDGKDPGEYDPLVMYWYEFDTATRTWQRHLISQGHDCGFDLDPKCIDLDQDGDIDILAAARSGLFLLENLRVDKRQDVTKTNSESTRAADELNPMKTPWHWGQRRADVLAKMQLVMGPLPDSHARVPLDVEVLEETDAGPYLRRKITYAASAGLRVPAFLLIPKKRQGAAPAMLCLHPTSPLGKSQICGLGGKPSRYYAHELAERGYVCLAPDYPSFGEYEDDFGGDSRDGTCGTMKGIWNHIRGIDLLESMPEVNPDRIGCIGHSLGGHNALFVAAFDQRLRAVVTSCGFTAFARYYDGDLTGWTSPRYMPRIQTIYDCDPQKMPFDFHDVLATIAPRPAFVNAPLKDSNFAVEGVHEVVAAASGIYEFLGAKDRLTAVYPDTGHDFPDGVRQSVYQWLDKQLQR